MTANPEQCARTYAAETYRNCKTISCKKQFTDYLLRTHTHRQVSRRKASQASKERTRVDCRYNRTLREFCTHTHTQARRHKTSQASRAETRVRPGETVACDRCAERFWAATSRDCLPKRKFPKGFQQTWGTFETLCLQGLLNPDWQPSVYTTHAMELNKAKQMLLNTNVEGQAPPKMDVPVVAKPTTDCTQHRSKGTQGTK